MVGSNYSKTLYTDYIETLTTNEFLSNQLKAELKAANQSLLTIQQQERLIQKSQEQIETLQQQFDALSKEVLRLNGLSKTDGSNSGLPTIGANPTKETDSKFSNKNRQKTWRSNRSSKTEFAYF